jgi:hypothetical protein
MKSLILAGVSILLSLTGIIFLIVNVLTGAGEVSFAELCVVIVCFVGAVVCGMLSDLSSWF